MFVNIEQQLKLFSSDWYDLEKDQISGLSRKEFDKLHTPDIFELGDKVTKRASSAFTFNLAYRPPFKPNDSIIRILNDPVYHQNFENHFKNVIFDLNSMSIEVYGNRLKKSQFDTLFGGRIFYLDNLHMHKTHSASYALLNTEGYRPAIRKISLANDE